MKLYKTLHKILSYIAGVFLIVIYYTTLSICQSLFFLLTVFYFRICKKLYFIDITIYNSDKSLETYISNPYNFKETEIISYKIINYENINDITSC